MSSCILSRLSITIIIFIAVITKSYCFSFMPEQVNNQTVYKHTFYFNTSDNSSYLTLYFFPYTSYGIVEEHTRDIKFDYSLKSLHPVSGNFSVSDSSVVGLKSRHDFTFYPKALRYNLSEFSDSHNSSTGDWLTHNLTLIGLFLGRATLNLHLTVRNDSVNDYNTVDTGLSFAISVIRVMRPVDIIFRVVIWVFVLFANTGMGMELEMSVIVAVLKKPIAPVLGFIAQYIFMPLTAFAVLQFLDFPSSTALGYFGMGCAPGGGASNFYCLLLGGNVSLSITMTLISTVAALGMVPLYMFTLGQYILNQGQVNIQIPYLNIILTLFLILIPSALGYAIKMKLPKFAKVYRKILKPMVLIFVIFMFTFGVYANLFIWRLFSPAIIAAGCILPYSGFLLGGALSAIFKQNWANVKTIAIETGIQNPGVPILILLTSLPQPEADMSLVGPVAAATFTPLPLLVWIIIKMSRDYCNKKNKDKNTDKNESDDAATVEMKQAFLNQEETSTRTKSKI